MKLICGCSGEMKPSLGRIPIVGRPDLHQPQAGDAVVPVTSFTGPCYRCVSCGNTVSIQVLLDDVPAIA